MSKLIVFEGICGSGKTTQINNLKCFLEKQGYEVLITKWLSGKYSRFILDTLNLSENASHKIGSHVIATDFAWRMESIILPALENGTVVICDRYIYTALTRDVLRGCNKEYLRKIYSFAPKEDLTFFFNVEPKIASVRKSQSTITFFEAAFDIFDKRNQIYESLNLFEKKYYSKEKIKQKFIEFQGYLINEYISLPEFKEFCIIDATLRKDEISKIIEEKCLNILNKKSSHRYNTVPLSFSK